MSPRFAPLALGLCASLALTCAPASRSNLNGAAVATPVELTGQWIWTRADAEIFARTHALHPELRAAVLAGTIAAGPRGLELRRGLAPSAGGADPVALL